MEDNFKEILEIEDVLGALFLSRDGKLLFNAFKDDTLPKLDAHNWTDMILALGDVRSAEVVYEHKRIYFHRAKEGFIVVITGWFAPMAMVRLNCDVVAPSLASPVKKAKGLARFFKRP